jgi:hypothetical protein
MPGQMPNRPRIECLRQRAVTARGHVGPHPHLDRRNLPLVPLSFCATLPSHVCLLLARSVGEHHVRLGLALRGTFYKLHRELEDSAGRWPA